MTRIAHSLRRPWTNQPVEYAPAGAGAVGGDIPAWLFNPTDGRDNFFSVDRVNIVTYDGDPPQYLTPPMFSGFSYPETSHQRYAKGASPEWAEALAADPENNTGCWQVYADALQAKGDERGDALAVELHAHGRVWSEIEIALTNGAEMMSRYSGRPRTVVLSQSQFDRFSAVFDEPPLPPSFGHVLGVDCARGVVTINAPRPDDLPTLTVRPKTKTFVSPKTQRALQQRIRGRR